jgi:hypothetical protein
MEALTGTEFEDTRRVSSEKFILEFLLLFVGFAAPFLTAELAGRLMKCNN